MKRRDFMKCLPLAAVPFSVTAEEREGVFTEIKGLVGGRGMDGVYWFENDTHDLAKQVHLAENRHWGDNIMGKEATIIIHAGGVKIKIHDKKHNTS